MTPGADGVTLIDAPHILPFCRSNIRQVRGRDGDTIGNGGMSVVSLRAQVSQAAERSMQAVFSHCRCEPIDRHRAFSCCLGLAAEADQGRCHPRQYAGGSRCDGRQLYRFAVGTRPVVRIQRARRRDRAVVRP